MNKAQLLVSALILVLLLVACAPQADPATAPSTARPEATATRSVTASAVPVLSKPAWQREWERVIAEAQREGRLALSTTAGADVRTALATGFKQAYGISIEAIAGKGAETAAKILSERRVGLYNYDVYVAGTSTPVNDLKPAGVLAPLDASLLLPDLTDPELIKKTWFQGKLQWIDRDHTVVAGQMFPAAPLAINTQLVKQGEIKSFKDLEDTKWKGKLLLNDPTVAGIAGSSFVPFVYNVMGRDWLIALAKQEPIILRDQRLQLEWLSHGKVSVLLAVKMSTYTELKSAGAPIETLIPKEGTWLNAGDTAAAIIKNSPHPSAAKLFVNWILSKEGQTIVSKVSGGQSARLDVPTDFLPPDQTRQAGVEYWNKETEELLLKGPEMYKMARDIFGHLLK